FVQWRLGDAILLGEANVPMDHIVDFFGDGDRMHLLYNFHVNRNLFLAMVQGSAKPLERALRDLPELPETGQWGSFLRNADEIDLSQLAPEEMQQVFAECGP